MSGSVSWLDEWREQRRENRNKVIPLSIKPFGVKQAHEYEIADWLRDSTPSVVVILSSTPLDTERIVSAIKSKDARVRVVEYSVAAGIDKESTHGLSDHFPTWTAMANKAVREGLNVVMVSSGATNIHHRVSKLAETLFTNGARAVVVYDPSTMYESEWESDGVTGVFWSVP